MRKTNKQTNQKKKKKRRKIKPDLVYLMQLHVKKKMDWNERDKENLFAHHMIHTYSFFKQSRHVGGHLNSNKLYNNELNLYL